MDAVHAELDELMARAHRTPDAQLYSVVRDIDAHLSVHFETEDRWMREAGFPGLECHLAEHACVLMSSRAVVKMALEGDVAHARVFIDELQQWFPAHATHLDSALAVWLCLRQYGGAPVVLHQIPPPAERVNATSRTSLKHNKLY